MSNVAALAPSFFDLYSRGEIAANRIEDFVSRWHASGDEEERSLAAFLGLTDDEYDVLLMDPDTLPHILYARRSGKGLTEVMADHLATMQRTNRSEDRAVARALDHWLHDQPGR